VPEGVVGFSLVADRVRVEEFKEVRLILNQHALSLALKFQTVLGLFEVCSVSEEGVEAVMVHYACAC
jgi:hypothetical protein